jgi:hypothetical protein
MDLRGLGLCGTTRSRPRPPEVGTRFLPSSRDHRPRLHTPQTPLGIIQARDKPVHYVAKGRHNVLASTRKRRMRAYLEAARHGEESGETLLFILLFGWSLSRAYR